MSQASKHVDWCLKKANKEIEECKKLSKRLKHRGLLKTFTRKNYGNNTIFSMFYDFSFNVPFWNVALKINPY